MTNKTPNYSAAQEDMIRAAAPLDKAGATALAELFADGKTYRSVIAKAGRMGVAYNRQKAVTKTGAPVEKKETIVSEIVEIVGGNLEGLEKAPKQTLQTLRDFLNA